jgi:hypothetical protein
MSRNTSCMENPGSEMMAEAGCEAKRTSESGILFYFIFFSLKERGFGVLCFRLNVPFLFVYVHWKEVDFF